VGEILVAELADELPVTVAVNSIAGAEPITAWVAELVRTVLEVKAVPLLPHPVINPHTNTARQPKRQRIQR
jgi:hypothetical protein